MIATDPEIIRTIFNYVREHDSCTAQDILEKVSGIQLRTLNNWLRDMVACKLLSKTAIMADSGGCIKYKYRALVDTFDDSVLIYRQSAAQKHPSYMK